MSMLKLKSIRLNVHTHTHTHKFDCNERIINNNSFKEIIKKKGIAKNNKITNSLID